MSLKTLRSSLASFIFYSFLGVVAIASPVRRNGTQQYTFADVSASHADISRLVMQKSSANSLTTQIVPTTDLQWFPCEEVYFCAMLQVRTIYLPLFESLAKQ